ncbi:MAG: hypothetical protein Q8P31_13720 [Bacillota bacterium]|nr:hypothetical protein [Bacillota bacterium]
MQLVAGTLGKVWFLIAFTVIFWFFVDRTAKGHKLVIRRIAGFDALDEAIGRCTEMGRPVHYTFGVGELDANVLASFDVLGYVSGQCARMDTDIIITNALGEVQMMTEEIVRSAYVHAGKPDAYKADNVRFVSSVQTAYMSAILGIFQRERPGANLMLGPFFAESMMLAEAGQQIGAIQVGGTGRTIQVPFFIAACDYTLIGDELFVAGAYIGRKPLQVGAVYAQDFGKWLTLLLIVAGTILATSGNNFVTDLMKK